MARLVFQKPEMPQQMIEPIGELPYKSFVEAMLSLELGLTFEDDFKRMGQTI